MLPEYWTVAALSLLLAVLIFAEQLYNDLQKGAAWALSNRSDQAMTERGARFDRAIRNHLENAALYVPIALVVAAAGLSTSATAIAALVFVAARIGHSLTYVLGIIYIRSAFWMVGIAATVVAGWPMIAALM